MHRVATSNPPSSLEAGPSRPALFTRLHALLPQSPLSPHSPIEGNNSPPTPLPQLRPRQPTFLKVRIVTWNMHESLPKGDLQELLGRVPVYTSPPEEHSLTDLPHLPNDSEHGYHLVVIAGQECPSLSGIPLGLGAGFKLGGDKDKDKDKDKDRDRDRDNEGYEHSELLLERRAPKAENDEPVPHTSGWTSTLEDFLVQGLTIVGPGARVKHKSSHPDLGPTSSTGDIRRRPKTGAKGPYEMLVKERMMGIYLAVFVHRDAKHFVRGTSKSAVTAGLIGGRVGNKGAVGISLKIANTTMLFVNAHLAAHEGKVPHRLANLTKIKNELAVDDFLKADDPRMVAEDITDRFDFTFLFGDLNFRLDLSRLHADWLISRREYAQALAFDQLYNIMRNGQAFVGFHEAPINFPPTFKYDVLRTIKHKRRRSKHRQAVAQVLTPPSQESPPEAGEDPEQEERHDGGLSELSSEDDTGELASVISSGTTFSQRDQVSDEDNDSSAESDYLRRRMAYPQRSGGLVKRISMSAAQRAKTKWAELISAPSSPRVIRSRRPNAPASQVEGGGKGPRSVPTTPLLGQRSAPSADKVADSVLANAPPLGARVRSSQSFTGSGTVDDDDDDDDKGVYDSSSKQRVPSWCDRILFKSTVEPDPEPEDDSHAAPQRSAVSLLAQAWRSFRRTSSSSLRSVSTLTTTSTTSTATSAATSVTSSSISTFVPPTDSEPDAARFPPPPYVPRRKRPRPRSIDVTSSSSIVPAQQPAPDTSRFNISPTPRSHRLSGAKITAPSIPTRTMTAPSPLPTPHERHHLPLWYPEPPIAVTPASSLGSQNSTSGFTSTSSSDGGMTVGAAGSAPGVVAAAASDAGGGAHQRWRLLSFLSRDAEATRDVIDASAVPIASATGVPATAMPPYGPDVARAATESPRPRKGDVVCLSYRTLDDRGMRRLEGRSDHRPVMGVYAIYV